MVLLHYLIIALTICIFYDIIQNMNNRQKTQLDEELLSQISKKELKNTYKTYGLNYTKNKYGFLGELVLTQFIKDNKITRTKVHITDNLLRQRSYDQLFKTNYDKGTSNKELMLKNGFVEIYDCGQSTYRYD